MGPRLIGRKDEEVSDAVREIREKEGTQICTGASCSCIENQDGKIVLNADCDEGAEKIIGSHILLAVGRKPNTDDLGFDKAGVGTDQRGYVTVDDALETNISGIWAIGDVNGRGPFTHTSCNDYEILVANMFDNDPRKLSDRITNYGLFIDLPLGRVGMTETPARKSGKKVLVDAETKCIQGAKILGISGDEVIHSLPDIMYADVPYAVIQRAVHVHPTVSELIPTMLGDLKPLE